MAHNRHDLLLKPLKLEPKQLLSLGTIHLRLERHKLLDDIKLENTIRHSLREMLFDDVDRVPPVKRLK